MRPQEEMEYEEGTAAQRMPAATEPTAAGRPLFFHCMACGDIRPIDDTRRHCLCGLSSARCVNDRVVVAGPGRVSFSPSASTDRDDVAVLRPSVAVAD